MKHIQLNALFPKNRDSAGWLRVEVDGRPVAEFRALARGSRGPGDTSLLNKGNTPTGTYSANDLIETRNWEKQRSYGPYGAVRLKPISGNAVLAEVLGRSGLLIHGGAPGDQNTWPSRLGLRPTRGCIRLSNADMKELIALLTEARSDGTACLVTDIQLSVQEMP